jgi:hypothetical protein
MKDEKNEIFFMSFLKSKNNKGNMLSSSKVLIL